MRTLARAAFAVLVVYGIMNGSHGAIANADDSLGGATRHASVRAYPNAIVLATDPGSGVTVSQPTSGNNIGRGEWIRHCWPTNATAALAASPVPQGTVPAK
jgi:hypothetical protein